MMIHLMTVCRIVQAYGVAMQLKRPIILIVMVMVLELVIQVPIVVPLFQMDGLQTVMILSQTVEQIIQMSVVLSLIHI